MWYIIRYGLTRRGVQSILLRCDVLLIFIYHGTSLIIIIINNNIVIILRMSLRLGQRHDKISTERPTADWAAIWLQLNTSLVGTGGSSGRHFHLFEPPPGSVVRSHFTPSTRLYDAAAAVSVLDPILACYTTYYHYTVQIYHNIIISTDTQTAPDPKPMLWCLCHRDFCTTGSLTCSEPVTRSLTLR